MTTPATSFFCFMSGIVERGVERFCDELTEVGVGGMTLAVSYHAARDLRPRASEQRLIDRPRGAVYFPPNRHIYPARAQPWAPTPYGERDLFQQVQTACVERDLRLTAWTVFGFDERLGEDPDLCQRSAFDDPMTSALCPANPSVGDYYRALAADVASRSPHALLSESLHYSSLRVTRMLVPLTPAARLAYDLCFCRHCLDLAGRSEIDGERVKEWARTEIDHSGDADLDAESRLAPDELEQLAGGEVLAYLRSRATEVARLTASVRAAVAKWDVELCFMDQAAAEPGLLGSATVDDTLRFGVDVSAIAEHCDSYQVLGYSSQPEAIAADVADYTLALGGRAGVRLALRPSPPDCWSTANLAEKVELAVRAGIESIDFYNLDLISNDAVERVREVIAR